MLLTASVTKINVFGVGLPKPEIKKEKTIDFTFPPKPSIDKFPAVKPYLING